MANVEKEFKQETKGTFKIKGIITGLDNKNTFKEGVGKTSNRPWRSIRFGIKTSPINKIDVEMFANEQDYVYPYSSKDKKTLKIPFEHRNTFKEEGYFEKNKKLFADSKKFPKKTQLFNPEKDHIDTYQVVGISLTGDDNKRVNFCEFDATEKILEMFSEGDSVYLSGELKSNTFINKKGIEVNGVKYIINSIKKEDPIDFEDKDFQEFASFEQDVVIVDTYIDEKNNKTVLDTYTIGYADKIEKLQLVVHADKQPKMAEKFSKFKFGDYIKVQGLCINEAEQTEIEDTFEEDEFGSETPVGYQGGASTQYHPELRVTAVAKNKDNVSIYTKGRYTKEDFVVEEKTNVSLDELDGLDEEVPTGINDDEENVSVEDDDELPF